MDECTGHGVHVGQRHVRTRDWTQRQAELRLSLPQRNHGALARRRRACRLLDPPLRILRLAVAEAGAYTPQELRPPSPFSPSCLWSVGNAHSPILVKTSTEACLAPAALQQAEPSACAKTSRPLAFGGIFDAALLLRQRRLCWCLLLQHRYRINQKNPEEECSLQSCLTVPKLCGERIAGAKEVLITRVDHGQPPTVNDSERS